MKKSLLLSVLLFTTLEGLSGCLVAGYSSTGGFYVWPGSVVITLLLLLLFLLLRRGR